MSGDEISRKDFVAYFGTRQISMDAMENDADLRPLLRVTSADGTQRVRDEDGDGYISAAEAEGLFDAVDHFDSNGDLHSVDPSDPKVGRLTDAIAALSERSQGTRSISPGGRDERIELPPGHRRSPSVRSVISGKGSEIGPRTSGESVRLVQQRLADLSAFAGEASGHFDQATEAAVRDFQAENCLPETGVVDGPTAQVLFPRVPESRPRNPSGEPLVPADYVSLADLQRGLDVVFDRHGVTVTGSVRGRSRSNDVPYARIGQRELADAEAKVSDWWNGKADAKAKADPDYQPWTWDKSVDFFFEHNRAVRNRPALQNARTMAYTSGNQAETSCWHTAGAMFDKVINKPVRREYINGKGKPTDTHESAQNMMSHVLGQGGRR